MKILFVLLALFGLGMGLQFPLEYTYNYTGRVATGIPELSSQVAGAGIWAKLVVQVSSKSKVLMKLEDVKVGDLNEEMHCNIRDELPIDYHPINGPEAIKLMEPFVVKLTNQKGDVMEVESDEPLWVTNIKKSIANVFRLEPLLTNFGAGEAFSGAKLEESSEYFPYIIHPVPSLYGDCEERYSMNQIPYPVMMAMNLTTERYIIEDVQVPSMEKVLNYRTSDRVPTEIPPIKNEVYKIVRSINFDNCLDRVAFQHTDVISRKCDVGVSQCNNLESRTSVSEYILRGEPNNFRMEKAIVEGTIITSPYGYKTQYVQTITNQTITLLRVKPITRRLDVPKNMREVRTWKFETISPYTPSSSHPVDWVRFQRLNAKDSAFLPELLTIGEVATSELLTKAKTELLSFMKEVMEELEPTHGSKKIPMSVPELLRTTARLVNIFPVKELKEVYDEVLNLANDPNNREIIEAYFIDVLAVSGSGPAVKLLLEKMKENKMTPARMGAVFMTFTSNLVPPIFVEPLVDYVLTLNMEEMPEVTSLGLVNVAALAHRLCFNPPTKYRGIPFPLFGEGICPAEKILEKFYSHIKSKLESTTETWKRAIYVQTLVNLGVPHTFPLLSKIALGTIEVDPQIRINAIYGFNRFALPPNVWHRESIFELLMQIFENWGEDVEVRQAAFAVMLSWSPSPVWWQRMALSTWRDSSRQVASFVTSTIESIAYCEAEIFVNLTAPAMHVMPLARPVPFSFKYSRNYIVSKYLLPLKFVVRTEGLQPYINKFQNVMFGRKPNGEPYHPIDTTIKEEAEKVMQEIHEELKDELRLRNSTEMNFYYKIFDHIQQFISIDEKRIDKFDLRSFLSKWENGKRFYLSKYINPYDLTSFMPTDLGLPMIILGTMPISIMTKGELKLTFPEGTIPGTLDELLVVKKALIDIELDHKLTFGMSTVSKVLLPWEKKAIAAGVEVHSEVVLPLKMKLNMTNELLEKSLELLVEPTLDKKQSLLYVQNTPFTVRKSMYPIEDVTNLQDMKIIHTHSHQIFNPTTWEYEKPVGYEPISPKYTNIKTKIPMHKLMYMLREENTVKTEGTRTFGIVTEFIGGEPREYSILGHFENKYISVDRRKLDLEVAFLRSKIPTYDPRTEEMCMKLLLTTPKMSALDTMEDMKSFDLKSTIDMHGYFNKDCKTSPISELKLNVDMTEERKTKIIEHLKDMCDYVDFDAVRTFLHHSVYDKGNVEFKWEENLPKGLMNITYKLDDLVMAYLYPNMSVNRFEHSPPRTVTVEGFRPMKNNKWEIVTMKPTMKLIFNEINVPRLIDYLMPMRGEPRHLRPVPEKSTVGETEKCVIKTDIIRTFDGVELRMPHENTCWRLAAKDCSPMKEWLVETRLRTPGQPELRLYAPVDGLEVFLKRGEIMINKEKVEPKNGAETVYDEFGAVKYEIAKRGEYVLFYLPGRVEIVVKNWAEIKVLPRYLGVTCGLCGDYNTEALADLTGPMRCIYNDTALFDASWTIMSNAPEKCTDNTLITLMERVRRFQEVCPKFHNGPLHNREFYVKSGIESAHSCKLHLYSVLEKGPVTCVAERPVTVCNPTCIPHGTKPAMITYQCWPRDVVEPKIRDQVIPGFIRFPLHLPAGLTKTYSIQVPETCTKH